MARPPDRTFSFGNDDESSLDMNAIGQGRPDSYYQPQDTAYRDYQVSPPPRSHTYFPTRGHDTNPPTPPTHRSPFRDHPPLPQPTDSTHSEPGIPACASRRLPPLSTQAAAQRSRDIGHSTSNRTASTITPGADNMGEAAAGGGIAGVALGVANHNERESGVEALRGMPQERGMLGTDTPYIPPPTTSSRADPFATPAPSMQQTDPFDDTTPRASAAPSPGRLTPRYQPSDHSIPLQQYGAGADYAAGRSSYSDNPYKRVSTAWDPRINRGEIDPQDIADDGDDEPVSRKRSVLGMRTHSSSVSAGAAAGGQAAGAAGGGILGTLGGLVGKSSSQVTGDRDLSGQYGPVSREEAAGEGDAEKSEWLSKQTSGRKRLRWIVGTILVLLIIGGIVGGVIGGIKAKSNQSNGTSAGLSGGGGESAAEDDGGGDLDKNSPEIGKLMDNKDLHKVFPGMAYLPYGAQYPACLSWPPSQNNVTRDLAVLSQLTNVIRLYGTDCNQTEMVLHSIDRLELTDMKVWLGVWLGNNETTNDRQLQSMNDIIAKSGTKPFAGVVIGNEVLYREDLTATELAKILADVKKNFTAQKIDLPIATSDLGDDWTPALASEVDIVMSNIHPFFAGVTAEKAAAWTWNFWKQKDALIQTATPKKNIISEVGWPSEGGNACGPNTCTSDTQGSVAGIEEMNTFMDHFVCQSLANGTDYFWFESYDQPWQKQFNKGDRNWEDHWGLMGIDRKLKDGVKIPDCGGKTVAPTN